MATAKKKYTKQGFVNGQVLHAKHLIAIEDAIKQAETYQDETDAAIGKLEELSTTNKSSIVAAVNEIYQKATEDNSSETEETGTNAIWKPTVSDEGEISWEKSADETAPAAQNIKGADGFSPTASVQETEDGAVITITDKTGTTTATIKNGADGGGGSDSSLTPITTTEIDEICADGTEEEAVVIESDEDAVELSTTEETAE